MFRSCSCLRSREISCLCAYAFGELSMSHLRGIPFFHCRSRGACALTLVPTLVHKAGLSLIWASRRGPDGCTQFWFVVGRWPYLVRVAHTVLMTAVVAIQDAPGAKRSSSHRVLFANSFCLHGLFGASCQGWGQLAGPYRAFPAASSQTRSVGPTCSG